MTKVEITADRFALDRGPRGRLTRAQQGGCNGKVLVLPNGPL